MIKKIIATLILLAFPILSRADASIYEGMTIGANASTDNNIQSMRGSSADSTISIDGTITAVNGNEYTVKDKKSDKSYIVNSESRTSIQGNVSVGQDVMIYGNQSSSTDADNTIDATRIENTNDAIIQATSSVEVEKDGFFKRIMNWFKSWFR